MSERPAFEYRPESDPWVGQMASMAEVWATPDTSVRWIVDGLLGEQQVACLAGRGSSLKTMLLLDLAVCVAARKPWLERYATERTGVLWLNADGPGRMVKERLKALCRGHDIAEPPGLAIQTIDFPAPPFNPQNEEDVAQMIGRAKHFGIGLIVVDCLRKILHGVDENSSDVDGIFLGLRRIAEGIGGCVVVIHHSSKAGGVRGSSAIVDGVDVALAVERPNQHVAIAEIEPVKEREAPIAHISLEFLPTANEDRSLRMARCRLAPASSGGLCRDRGKKK